MFGHSSAVAGSSRVRHGDWVASRACCLELFLILSGDLSTIVYHDAIPILFASALSTTNSHARLF
jgi:hypothetical protein